MEHDMKAVIDAARLSDKAVALERVGTTAHWLVPGGSIHAIDMESTLPSPVRKRGTVQVFDAASFNAILAANDDAGAMTVYIDRDANDPRIVAVMNGHGDTGPGWGDFRVEIVFRFTGQWTKWKAIDGRMLSQAEFAEFIEDNLHDVVFPVGAEMLEIAQYFSATRSVDFKSAMRLSNGQIQFHNLESVDAKVGAGATQVPETITLGIAPVFGLSPFRVEAKFRYRLADGKLRMGIKLHRVEDVMAAVVNDMVHGVVGSESRMGTIGIVLPPGAVMVEGIAPDATK